MKPEKKGLLPNLKSENKNLKVHVDLLKMQKEMLLKRRNDLEKQVELCHTMLEHQNAMICCLLDQMDGLTEISSEQLTQAIQLKRMAFVAADTYRHTFIFSVNPPEPKFAAVTEKDCRADKEQA